MRRCTILKCIHQEAELFLCFFWCEAQNFEHLSLQLGIVNTNRATSYFDTINDHIVCIGTNSRRIGIKHWDVFIFRMSERMMHSHQATFFFAPFKHWEINNPQACELIFVAQA